MGTTQRKLNNVVQYLLTWLCYENAEAAARVALPAGDRLQLAQGEDGAFTFHIEKE